MSRIVARDRDRESHLVVVVKSLEHGQVVHDRLGCGGRSRLFGTTVLGEHALEIVDAHVRFVRALVGVEEEDGGDGGEVGRQTTEALFDFFLCTAFVCNRTTTVRLTTIRNLLRVGTQCFRHR